MRQITRGPVGPERQPPGDDAGQQQPCPVAQDVVARPPGPGRGSKLARCLLAVVAAVGLVAAGGAAGAVVALHYAPRPTTVTVSAPPAGRQAGAVPTGQLAAVAAAMLPSVVTIKVESAAGSGEGSGVILRSDGTIVTNNHVIEAATGGAGMVTVTFASGQSKNAVILGRDPAADIAVIRAFGVSGAAPARLGNSAALRVGDAVLAIGSPLGLPGTVTAGIVSALHRSLTVASQSTPASGASAAVLGDVIQTDTAINPGNSGGALIDASGAVVGITTAIATVGGGYLGQQSGSIGLGFAVPISAAYRIAARLLAGKSGAGSQ